MLTAQDLSLSFGGPKLFENVGLEIKHGEKVFLIGPNGCGKTSLFKILLGQYTPDTGVVRLGSAIDVGYYEQSQLSLHDEKTVMDEIWDIHPQMTQTQVRSALAVFLFKGEDVFKLVGKMCIRDRVWCWGTPLWRPGLSARPPCWWWPSPPSPDMQFPGCTNHCPCCGWLFYWRVIFWGFGA